jgi:hypothetical protein
MMRIHLEVAPINSPLKRSSASVFLTGAIPSEGLRHRRYFSHR